MADTDRPDRFDAQVETRSAWVVQLRGMDASSARARLNVADNRAGAPVETVANSPERSTKGRQPWYDQLGDLLSELDRVPVRHGLHLGRTQRRVLGHVGQERVDVHQRRSCDQNGFLDAVVVPVGVGAMLAQHVELVRDLGGVGAEHISRVGVAGHQPQRPLLAPAADHDRRVGPADRRGHAQRLGQLVVLAVERAVVLAPHLQADPQRFL